MAEKKSPKLVSNLRKFFSGGEVTRVAVDVTDVSYRSISDTEMQNIVKEVYTPNNNNRSVVDKQHIPAMLEPIGRELIDKRVDQEKLSMLAPEIDQAASILIPSILSPNDFRKNIFDVVIGGGNETDAVKSEVVKLIKRHFDEELDLSTKLSSWIHEAMFKMGSKAIMLLPTSTIGHLRDRIGSVESLSSVTKTLIDTLEASVEHISLDSIRKSVYSDDDIVDKAVATGIFDDFVSGDHDATKRTSNERKVRTYIKGGLSKAFEKLDIKKHLSFSDDPRMIFKSKLSNTIALEKIDSAILAKLGSPTKPLFRDPKTGIANNDGGNLNQYDRTPYIDLSDFIHDDDVCAYPAMIELPSESIIPIIIEGSPSTHIGYFVLMNVNGSPISAESDNFGDLSSTASGSQRINNLYNSFYGTGEFSIHRRMAADAKAEILNSIYDSFIRNMMHSKLDKMGLSKHHVDLSSNISKVMLTRLIKGSETRIVFVPKKLMIYMAFQFNPDGTGKSKIDNIKFPLSLKMTLIITRLISLIESSINRRSLNITLDEGIGNPLELLRSVKKDIISNKMYGLSYDPSTIIKSVLDKELTIIPNKIPGVEEFTLSDTPNNVEYPKPDDAILEEINKMYMMSLGVPPSAMNRLGEAEFSRSVAANNIFFSNQLKTEQKVVCIFMTELITTYTNFSEKLRESILEILRTEPTISGSVEAKVVDTKLTDGKIDSETKLEDDKDSVLVVATDDKLTDDTSVKKTKVKDEKKAISLETRFVNLINNIKFTLPSPNLSQDMASFDDLKDYIEIIDTVLLNLFPDDMVVDAELGGTVKALRSMVKRDVLQKHIKANSLLSDLNFDALSNLDVSSVIDSSQKVMNLKAALTSLTAVMTSKVDEAVEPGSAPPSNW